MVAHLRRVLDQILNSYVIGGVRQMAEGRWQKEVRSLLELSN